VQAVPILEVREEKVHPSLIKRYTQYIKSSTPLRNRVLPQTRLLSMPSTGDYLNKIFHLYAFKGGLQEREQLLFDLEFDENNREGLSWARYLESGRSLTEEQKSSIFVEAPLVHSTKEIVGLMKTEKSPVFDIVGENDKKCIYEIRKYKLKLGYDTVPNFLSLYGDGLPSKLHADGTDPETELITLMYTEVGELNEVIEVWRHGNGVVGMENSRNAARSAQSWRKAIAKIALLAKEFTSTIHIPLEGSPMR